MENKQVYQEKMQAKFDELNSQIEVLEAKARGKKADAKSQGLDYLEKLTEKKKEFEDRLDDFKGSGESAWKEVKSGVDSSFEELKSAFQKATAQF